MPIRFPDIKSLKRAAEIHNFRQPNEDESEQAYRAALANHVTPRDRIEGHEIRTGKGWNEWNAEDKIALFRH